MCRPVAAEYLAYARAWPALALLFARVPSAAVHILDLVAVDAHENEAATQAQHIARVFFVADAARRAVTGSGYLSRVKCAYTKKATPMERMIWGMYVMP